MEKDLLIVTNCPRCHRKVNLDSPRETVTLETHCTCPGGPCDDAGMLNERVCICVDIIGDNPDCKIHK